MPINFELVAVVHLQFFSDNNGLPPLHSAESINPNNIVAQWRHTLQTVHTFLPWLKLPLLSKVVTAVKYLACLVIHASQHRSGSTLIIYKRSSLSLNPGDKSLAYVPIDLAFIVIALPSFVTLSGYMQLK